MKINIADVLLGNEELSNVIDAVKSNWISSKGKYIPQFEKRFSSYIGRKYGISSSNGTTALHIALLALGIGKGDEVIVPSLTYVANSNTVHYTGATPVFADSNETYWCIDPDEIEQHITKRTKAIVPVHIYGHPCDMDQIMKIAEKHGLHVIEDAAESHGAEYKGRKTGTFGDVSCFSFYGNKVITTGEGGMSLTNNLKLSQKMRMLEDIHYNPKKMPAKDRFHTEFIGYNYRMTNIEAAIGVAQVGKINEIIIKKRKVAHYYNSLLKEVEGVVTQPEMPWAKNVYWYYSILVSKKARDRLMARLAAKGIETRPFFYPLHRLKMHRVNGKTQKLPVSESLYERGINLPSSPWLTKAQIKYVCDSIADILS